jgi:hypothetical protein
MGKALDVLTDLARQNPQKALTYVNSFADAINTKADDSSNTTNSTDSTGQPPSPALSDVSLYIFCFHQKI